MKSNYNGTVLVTTQPPITAFIRFESINLLVYGLVNGELIFHRVLSNPKDAQEEDDSSRHPSSTIAQIKLSFGALESIKYIGDTKLLYVYSQGCIFQLYLDIKAENILKIIEELDSQSFKRTKLIINFKNSFFVSMEHCFVMFVPSYSKIIKYYLKDNHTTTFDTPFVNKIPVSCVGTNKETMAPNTESKRMDKWFVLFKREDLSGVTLFIEEINTCTLLYKIDLNNKNKEKLRKKYNSFQLYKDDSYFYVYFLDDNRCFYEFKLKLETETVETKTIKDATREIKISKDPILFYTMDIKNSFSLFMCRNNKIKFVDMKNLKVTKKYKRVYGKYTKFPGLYTGIIKENLFMFTCDDGIVALDI